MANTHDSLHDTVDPHETLSIDEAHHAHVHVTPFWPMFWVFAILLVLTALTVWSSNIHGVWIGNTHIEFGPTPHILLALVIATVKALLVAAYFMHLKYDNPMNTAVVGATIFAAILFIGLTLADSATRNVMDRQQHAKVVQGGTSHLVVNPETGEKTFVAGKGVVDAARENAKAHASNHGADHAGEAPAETPAAKSESAGGH